MVIDELIRKSKESNERIIKGVTELRQYKDLWIAFKEWNYENDFQTYQLMVVIEDKLLK